MSVTEYIISSDATGHPYNVTVWDPNTGTTLMSYKGSGAPAVNCLSVLGSEYLFTCNPSKPIIYAWSLNSQDISQQSGKFVCPGTVNSLALSPDARYCAVGISEKLFIWQISSGQLLANESGHVENINCIKFTSDCACVITGGFDGKVIVWSLGRLVSQYASKMFAVSAKSEPLYVFADHSLPVSSLCVGFGGTKALLSTVSHDGTCKVYSLSSGSLLVSLIFKEPMTSVTFGFGGLLLFVGTTMGRIEEIDLRNPPRTQQYHVPKNTTVGKYIGHTKSITCLSCSSYSPVLLSGSVDGNIKLWNISDGHCFKTVNMKGPVTNAFFVTLPKFVFSDLKHKIFLHKFGKTSHIAEPYIQNIMTQEHLEDEKVAATKSLLGGANTSEAIMDKERIQYLENVNFELYDFAIKNLLNPKNTDVHSEAQENTEENIIPACRPILDVERLTKLSKNKKKSKVVTKNLPVLKERKKLKKSKLKKVKDYKSSC